jgi:hypothetical protein
MCNGLRFGHRLAKSQGNEHSSDRPCTKKRGPFMYILFAAPAFSLAAIFAITLRDHFAVKPEETA